MNTELRAWVKFESGSWGMLNNENLGDWTLNELQDDDETCIIMRSTGLMDRNGDMIFEKDIINVGEHDFEKNLVVEWNERIAGFEMRNTTTRSFSYFDPEKTEIIGNIFENKELFNF